MESTKSFIESSAFQLNLHDFRKSGMAVMEATIFLWNRRHFYGILRFV